MKRTLYYVIAASAVLWSCNPDVQPLRFTAPVVEYEGTDTRSVSVGEPETFKAKVVEGEGLTMGWYVDGLLESSGTSLVYAWDVMGEYEVRFEASNGSGKTGKTYKVSVSDKLEIFLTSESDYRIDKSIECLEQSPLRVAAVVEKGSNVQHEWKVDGEVKGNEAYFGSFWLPSGTGTYNVSYTGKNKVGTFSHDFTVKVLERELTIEFSETLSTITHNPKNGNLTIVANVLFGGTGAVHTWSLDGKKVSDDAVLEYSLTVPGTYELKYHCENSKGETVDKTWNVNVLKRDEAFLEDYENGVGNGVFVQQQGGKLSIVDNPFPSEANSSSKVLMVTGGGSGYFGFVYDAVAKLGIDITQYDGIKVDMYITEDKFFPVMDYKGAGKVKANADTPYKYNEWVSLDYDLNFKTKGQLQPRPFVNATGGGNGNNSTVYYDNVYLYKK